MNKILLLLLTPLFLFSLTACEEEDQTSIGTPAEEDLQPIQDNTKAEQGVMNSTNYMNPYGLDEDLSGKKAFSSNPVYSISGPDSTVVTIDFSGVENMDGEIIITYSSNPTHEFDRISAEAELVDYKQGTVVYNGTLLFEMADSELITMSTSTPDGEELTIQDGNSTSTWSGERIMTWTEGSDTIDEMDDIYEVVGSSEGLTSNQTSYTSEILTALVFSPSCDYIMFGEQQLKNYVEEDLETTLTLNYNVDANEETLTEPDCNPYFNLNFVSQNLDVNMFLNVDDL